MKAPFSASRPPTPPASQRPAAPLERDGLVCLSEVLAHRLRGLVTGIEGYTDLLVDSLGDPEQRDLALRIFESAAGIERVLADLQRFSRPIEPVRRRWPIRAVLDKLFRTLDDDALERLRLDVAVAADQAVEADAILLRQSLLVLLQNALDATRPMGAVHFAVAVEDGWVRFAVQNAGVIPAEAAPRVFVPFFTTKAHNLGVGLPIARRIAEAHEGTLSLTANSPEEGIGFTLSLPVYPSLEAHSS